MKKITMILIISALIFSLQCNKAAIGESCSKSGTTTDECVDGAICTAKASGGTTTCLKICTSDSDCAATEACNGVSGANQKSCQPK